MAGLLGGKFLGVAGLSLVVVKLGWAELPRGASVSHIIGVSMMAAIGFTMSIFIAELAFTNQPDQLLAAKTGILFASLIAGVSGYCWLRFVAPQAAD
jgi:NhaA family Na+:H+ antiporter